VGPPLFANGPRLGSRLRPGPLVSGASGGIQFSGSGRGITEPGSQLAEQAVGAATEAQPLDGYGIGSYA
jgi:hypothetical protein